MDGGPIFKIPDPEAIVGPIGLAYIPKPQEYVPDLTLEADFCINHCPHSDCDCDGTCPEWEEFEKTLEDKRFNSDSEI